MVFFSRNRITALKRVAKLAQTDRSYKNKTVLLADKQIPHASGWKTWKITRRK